MALTALALGACSASDGDADGQTGGKGGKSATAGGGSSSAGETNHGATGSGGSIPVVPNGISSAADLARKLGRKANFLIGLGNDLPADYKWENASALNLGTNIDVHYVYITYGWANWNPGGYFAQTIAKEDRKKDTVPMVSVYGMTGRGEARLDVLADDSYMNQYWEEAKLLMQRYAELDTPAIVHLEPDFWAYAQQQTQGDPKNAPAHLHPDCKGLPEDISGMARCWFKLAHDNAPKVAIGLHASEWGGESVGDYLSKLGAAESDLVFIDMLDRDAGCFEDGTLAQCKRGGTFYLDETNQTSPNYSERLAFAKQVSQATKKPIMWWQLPLGVPSDTPGGSSGHFRDNKVHYVFNHIQEFVDAGGVGAAFGVGADAQTTVDTDGGQFKNAVKAYYESPVALP